jgi:hypothetical protein
MSVQIGNEDTLVNGWLIELGHLERLLQVITSKIVVARATIDVVQGDRQPDHPRGLFQSWYTSVRWFAAALDLHRSCTRG